MQRLTGAALVIALAGPALADSGWEAFYNSDGPTCFASAQPMVDDAARDDAVLSVLYRPADGVFDQISYTGGYALMPGSTVSLVADGTGFTLLTEGNWAWASNAKEDSTIVAALSAAGSVTLTGRSADGTEIRDTFDLAGFAAALATARARCGG